jgi:1-acyl-sn-glycerol-3-phosphate acyltransferase
MKFREILFKSLFYLWTAMIVIPFFYLWKCPRDRTVRHLYKWALGVKWLLRACVGVTIEIKGADKLPKGRALLVFNHESLLDTIYGHLIASGHDPCYIMKEELFAIPFYGQHARKMEMVGISREVNDRIKSLKTLLREVPEQLKAGRQVIIFPQGTRVPPGTDEVPYELGVFALYQHLSKSRDPELRSCPVVLCAHNFGRVWPKRGSMKFGKSGRVIFQCIGEVKAGLDRETFMAEVQGRISAARKNLP